MPDIPRIHIEQQAARIGIHTTHARVEASTPRPKMRIVREAPRMEIEHKAPAFKVETQRSRPYRPAVRHHNTAPGSAQRLKTHYAPGSANETPALENSGLSQSATALELNKVLNDYAASASAESLRPSIEWDSGYLNISWSKAQMQIEWDKEYMPTFSVEPHAVEIYLREKPYIKITIEDETAAMYGPYMDEQA